MRLTWAKENVKTISLTASYFFFLISKISSSENYIPSPPCPLSAVLILGCQSLDSSPHPGCCQFQAEVPQPCCRSSSLKFLTQFCFFVSRSVVGVVDNPGSCLLRWLQLLHHALQARKGRQSIKWRPLEVIMPLLLTFYWLK